MYQPSIFISHGAPDIAVKAEHPSHQFLRELPNGRSRPEAIVVFSAHWCTEHIMISKAESYVALHDFGGFDPRLYSMEYAPKGNPDIAHTIFNLLRKSDGRTELVDHSTLDHGAWIPLRLMYPEANIPVIQISIQPDRLPEYHYNLGASIVELRKHNILIIGSGAMSHNLYEASFHNHNAAPPEWVQAFADWMKDRLESGVQKDVLQYRTVSPYAMKNHPTEDHIIPLFIAMGAGNGSKGKRIHTATTYGTIMMDAYEFTEGKTDQECGPSL